MQPAARTLLVIEWLVSLPHWDCAKWKRRRKRVPRITHARVAAILTAIMGIVNMVSATTPGLRSRVRWLMGISPLEVRFGSHLTAVLLGFALVVLAYGLWRHKHAAWLLTIAVLLGSAAAHLLKGLDYEEATLALTLALYLWFIRKQFRARSDPPSVRQGIGVLMVAMLFTLTYGTVGFFLLDRSFAVQFSLGDALTETFTMFTRFFDPGLEPITGFGRYFANSIYIVGAVTLAVALWMLLRPVVLRQPATHADHQRAKTIIEAYGRSSLARFALFPDKSYWFSPGGSVVAFAAQAGVAIVLGDPIGPETDLEMAIAGFGEECAINDWLPAFYQTDAATVDSYRRRDYETLCIGHEAIVDLAHFTLGGNASKSVRVAVNHALKAGCLTEVYEPPLPAALVEELRSVSDAWLIGMHGSERRFSFGWFDHAYVRDSVVVLLRTEAGVVAFLNIVPEYARSEVGIDLMRRLGTVPSGGMEALFVALFQWAKAKGYATVSLGLSALAGVGERSSDPAAERALHAIYANVDQFYNFKGLHGFKQKFQPLWSPRYLAFTSYTALPSVMYALEAASSGNSFVWLAMRDWWTTQRRRLHRSRPPALPPARVE